MTITKKSFSGIAMVIVLITVLNGLAALVLILRNRSPESINTPAVTVSALIDAARNSDAEAYLGLTGGELRRSLEQARKEMGADAFREYLRKTAAGIKASVVPGIDDPPGDTVTIDVEFVFTDRNERQRTEFVRRGNGWVITSMEKTTLVKPPVAYGTPVFDEPPPQGATGSGGGDGEAAGAGVGG